MPPRCFQCSVFLLIPCNIAFELCLPERHIGLGHSRHLAALVPMPEAAVDEDDRVPLWEHDIGMSGQFGRMQMVAEAQSVEVSAYKHLRLRVLRPNPAHDLASLLWGDGVHYE